MEKLPPNMEDYEATRHSFHLDVPEYFNFGLDVIDRWAEDHTKLALISVSSDGERAEKHTFWISRPPPTGSPTCCGAWG